MRFFSLCIPIIFFACGASDMAPQDPFLYKNSLFVQTHKMTASSTLNKVGRPHFQWASTGRKHVVCAVFSERIQLKNNIITNQHKVVWLWHTGLGKGREGNVLYEHGVDKEGGTGNPPPLKKGTYYWAVWVLDDAGSPIPSTTEYTMIIK